jgi:hypothetical protein
VRDCRLPPRCRQDLRSSGALRSFEWQFCTEDSGQFNDNIFKGQELKSSWISWPLKVGSIDCPETSAQNYHSNLRKPQK